MTKLSEQLAGAFGPRYIISWTKIARHCNRWLHMTDAGDALLVHHREKATSFSREEANAVLLALWSSGRWSEAGENSFPHLEEMR